MRRTGEWKYLSEREWQCDTCGAVREAHLRPSEPCECNTEKAGMRRYPECVYVVVAHDTEAERIAEVDVFATIEQARPRFKRMKEVYGGANVCMAQRAVYGLESDA